MLLLIGLLYVAIHAGLYFAVLRDQSALGSEKGIFLYHSVSVAAGTAVMTIWAVASGGPDAWTWVMALVMLHAIYSLSFLELWALTDDSYSLAILEIIDREGATAGTGLARRLEAIGAGKQISRLDGLRTIGLVREVEDGSFAPTAAGRVAVFFGCTLLYLVNIRKHG